MAVDILKHEFVPPHEVLSKKDARAVLETLGLEKTQLPSIFASDPVITRIEAKVGDVIKITRKSPTSGVAVYYRVVV